MAPISSDWRNIGFRHRNWLRLQSLHTITQLSRTASLAAASCACRIGAQDCHAGHCNCSASTNGCKASNWPGECPPTAGQLLGAAGGPAFAGNVAFAAAVVGSGQERGAWGRVGGGLTPPLTVSPAALALCTSLCPAVPTGHARQPAFLHVLRPLPCIQVPKQRADQRLQQQ